MNEKIAVVNVKSFGREFPELIQDLEANIGMVDKFNVDRNETPENLAKLLNNYTYIVLGTTPYITDKFFELNTSVKLIIRYGIGLDNIDLEAAHKSGVKVGKIDNFIERDAVAEHAVSLLATVAKNVCKSNQRVHAGKWSEHREQLMGVQLTGKVTGVIGYGSIGRKFAEIMKNGFNNDILVYDPFILESCKKENPEVRFVSLEYLLNNSDFISLHCNLTQNNKNLINSETLKLCKDNSILINCARGGLVNESDVYQAVKNKKLFGYGADVAGQEPISTFSELLNSENIVLTPHVSIYNLTCVKNMTLKVMEDIYKVSGENKNEQKRCN